MWKSIETGGANNSLPPLNYNPTTYKQLNNTWNRINSNQDKDATTRTKLIGEFRSTIHRKLQRGGVYIHNENDLRNFIVTYAGKEQRQFLALKASLDKYLSGKPSWWAYKYEGVLTMDATWTMKLTHGTAAKQTDTDIRFSFSSTPLQWKNWKAIEDAKKQGRAEWIREVEERYSNAEQKIYGLTRDKVKQLQEYLKKTVNSQLKTDGIYGNNTRNAVRQLQWQLNQKTDGIYGDNTRTALKNQRNIMI